MRVAIDRLVCQDVDLHRMKLEHCPNATKRLLVDGEPAYVTTTRPEQRGEKYFIVTTEKWVGKWAHMNPPNPRPAEIDLDGGGG